MKKITFAAILLFVCTFSAASQVTGQTTGNTTPGPVWRVQYFRVLPGKMNDVLMDMRKNLRPVYDEAKKQGVIVDYKIYQNSTQSNPDEWNLALAVAYKNWGALDEATAKFSPISLKHYGSQEKIDAAAANRRQLFVTVASKLMREVTLNPLP